MSNKDKLCEPFTKLPRIHTVDERIENSEKFPRIRDAQIETLKKKAALRKKIEDRDFKREMDKKARIIEASRTGKVLSDADLNSSPNGKSLVEEDYIEPDFFSYVISEEICLCLEDYYSTLLLSYSISYHTP